MRYILFSSFIGLSVTMFSQQQQLGNVFLASNINPAIEISQSNSRNYRNNDNYRVNQMSQLDNSYKDVNDIQEQSYSNVRQTNASKNNTGIGINFSIDIASRASSSRSSNSRLNKRNFNRKFKKFERHVFGKMGSHKKSKHLVDVCFNWR